MKILSSLFLLCLLMAPVSAQRGDPWGTWFGDHCIDQTRGYGVALRFHRDGGASRLAMDPPDWWRGDVCAVWFSTQQRPFPMTIGTCRLYVDMDIIVLMPDAELFFRVATPLSMTVYAQAGTIRNGTVLLSQGVILQ